MIGKYAEFNEFGIDPVLRFHPSAFAYFLYYFHDEHSRIKFLDGTYDVLNKENILTHLEYLIISSNKGGMHKTIDTMEQYFTYDRDLHFLGFGLLNTLDSTNWVANVNGMKLKLSEFFYLREWSKYHGFDALVASTFGKYVIFPSYIPKSDSNNIDHYVQIKDHLISNEFGLIENQKGTLITINNKKVYLTEYSILLDDEGNKLEVTDITLDSKIDVEYFYHEYSKKNIALKVVKFKNEGGLVWKNENIIKVSGDTLHTSSSIIDLASVKSIVDEQGINIDITDLMWYNSLFFSTDYKQISKSDLIKNSKIIVSRFKSNEVSPSGSIIGKISSFDSNSVQIGSVYYTISKDSKIIDKFGRVDSNFVNLLSINDQVKIFFSNNETDIDEVVKQELIISKLILVDKINTVSVQNFNEPKLDFTNQIITTNSLKLDIPNSNILFSKYRLISNIGVVTHEKQLSGENCKIDFFNLQNGMYILELFTTNNHRYSFSLLLYR